MTYQDLPTDPPVAELPFPPGRWQVLEMGDNLQEGDLFWCGTHRREAAAGDSPMQTSAATAASRSVQ